MKKNSYLEQYSITTTKDSDADSYRSITARGGENILKRFKHHAVGILKSSKEAKRMQRKNCPTQDGTAEKQRPCTNAGPRPPKKKQGIDRTEHNLKLKPHRRS